MHVVAVTHPCIDPLQSLTLVVDGRLSLMLSQVQFREIQMLTAVALRLFAHHAMAISAMFLRERDFQLQPMRGIASILFQ